MEKEDKIPLRQVSIEDILEAQRIEQEEKQDKEKIRQKRFKELGLQTAVSEFSHDDAFWNVE